MRGRWESDGGMRDDETAIPEGCLVVLIDRRPEWQIHDEWARVPQVRAASRKEEEGPRVRFLPGTSDDDV